MPTLAIVIMIVVFGFSILIPLALARWKAKEELKRQLYTSPGKKTNENPPAAKKFGLLGGFISLLVLGVGVSLFLLIPSCSSTEKNPVVVLVKDKDKFVYHAFPYIVKSSIENKAVVETGFYSSVSVFPLKDGIYISPNDLLPFAMLFAQGYDLIEYDQRSHQGFFIQNEDFKMEETTELIPTDKIGQTERIHRIALSNAAGDKSLEISWKGGGQLEPISNCVIKSIWVVSNPHPGKTVGNYSDRLLVNLSELIKYFQPNARIALDEEQNLLFLDGF